MRGIFWGIFWSAIPAPPWHSAAYHLPLGGGPSATLLFFFKQQSACFLRHGGPLLFFLGTSVCPPYRLRSGIVPRIYCCIAVVLLSYIVGSWVVGCFFSAVCCVLYYFCYTTVRTAVAYEGGWVDRFIGFVHGFVDYLPFFFFFFSPPAIPAPRWHPSAYH